MSEHQENQPPVDFMAQVKERRLKELLEPSQTALLVVDMQNGYVDPNAPLPQLLGSTTERLQKMIDPLNRFITEVRNKGIPVFWTQMEEDPAVMAPNMSKKMIDEETPPITTRGKETYDFYGLSPEPGDPIIPKTHYNAFDDTDLDQQLKARGVTTLIVTGAYASRCVATTVVRASDSFGYNVVIPEDLIEGDDTMTKEKEGFLSVVQAILGETTTSQHITEILEQK